MNRNDLLIGIFEFREEIPDLLVSSCFLCDRIGKPKKFEKYGQEIMDIVKTPVNVREFDFKRLEKLYWAYYALYSKIAQDLNDLCEIVEKRVPRIILSPRLVRWRDKYNG